MGPQDYSDATLILLGHGSTKNEGSDKPVFQHAAELRRRGLFKEVREAFWKQTPHVRDVLASLSNSRVFIVPIFISEGYFSDQVIPQALGFGEADSATGCRVRQEPGRTLYYTRPVGSHPSMLCVLLARASEVLRQYPFPRLPHDSEVSLFIAGHGTGRNENSRKAIEQQAAKIASLNQYANVQVVFMEEAPFIRDCYSLAPTRHIVVVPFFISEGLHTQEDIPVMLGEPEDRVQRRLREGRPAWRNPTEKHNKLVWYAPSIGTEPHLADVILDSVTEAASIRGVAASPR